MDDVEIPPLAGTAEVVGLSWPPAVEHQLDASAMVFHEEPVPHVGAIPVDRQRLSLERIQQHQRNQLFRELVGTVVVGAITRRDGQPVGVIIGAHQVVGRGFARRVGRVGRVGCLLGEGRIVGPQGSIHLVRRDVMETNPIMFPVGPDPPRRLEQRVGADHVRPDEFVRAQDRAVHVRFGCEMHDRRDPVIPQRPLDCAFVADIGVNETIPGVGRGPVETALVARIRERVEVDDTPRRPLLQREAHKVRADEPRAAGDENHHHAFPANSVWSTISSA